jgi:organic hydroperoxide reductase OsmC/OhrA
MGDIMARTHNYEITVRWTGNLGAGTAGYRAYSRNHEIEGAGKTAAIAASSDPVFRGDPSRYNPEELLVAALASCHMLSLLHLCADAGIVVTGYVDRARGTMRQEGNGGYFTEVVLQPEVTVASEDMVEKATQLHADAHESCFIASSVNFPVRHEPLILTREA